MIDRGLPRDLPRPFGTERFEMLSLLGEGASGRVYETRDRELDQVVAVKVLHRHLLTSDTSRERLKQEVLLARRLSHPNIVSVYDFGVTPEGDHYISMERVFGRPLHEAQQRLSRRAFDVPSALFLFKQMLEALRHAHERGVIHRDIKPQNILIDDAARITIADFGTARLLEDDSSLTRTGELIGTLFYLAPEQIRDAKVDARADQYSVGIVLYEMLTGQKPFVSESYYHLLEQHLLHELPREPLLRAGIPLWLIELINRCTQKDPDLRLRDIDEVLELLYSHAPLLDDSAARESIATIMCLTPEERSNIRAKLYGVCAAVGIVFLLAVAAIRLHHSLYYRTAAAAFRLERAGYSVLGDVLKAIARPSIDPSADDVRTVLRRSQSNKRNFYNAVLAIQAAPEAVFELHGAELLAIAVQGGYFRHMTELFERGISPNEPFEGMMPIERAIRRCHSPIFAALIKEGASLDIRAPAGGLPIHLAMATRCAPVASLALCNVTFDRLSECDPVRSAALLRETDHQGQTPIHALLASRHTVLGSIEQASTESLEARNAAAVRVEATVTQTGLLLQAAERLPIYATDVEGRTPLSHAIRTGAAEILWIMLRHPATARWAAYSTFLAIEPERNAPLLRGVLLVEGVRLGLVPAWLERVSVREDPLYLLSEDPREGRIGLRTLPRISYRAS